MARFDPAEYPELSKKVPGFDQPQDDRRALPGETLPELQERRAVEDAVATHNAEVDAYQAQKEQERVRREQEAERNRAESALRENERISRGVVSEADKVLKDYPAERGQAIDQRDTTAADWKADEEAAKKRTWFGLGGQTIEAKEAEQRLPGYKSKWTEQQQAVDAIDTKAKRTETVRDTAKGKHERDKALVDQVDAENYRRNEEALGLSEPEPLTQQPFANLPALVPNAPVSSTSPKPAGQPVTSTPSPSPAPSTPSAPADNATGTGPTDPLVDSLPLDTRTWTQEQRKTWGTLSREDKQRFVARGQASAQERRDTQERGQASLEGAIEGSSPWTVLGDSIKGTFAPVMKGISSLGTGVLGTVAAIDRATGGDPTFGAEAAAKGIEDYWNEAIPEEMRGTVADKLGQGLGSALTFIPGGAAGAAVKGARWAVPAISAVSGAVTNGGQAYLEARDMGLSDAQAFERFALNAGIGTSEALGIGRVFSKLNRFTKGSLSKLALELAGEGVEEGLQEFGQSAASDLADLLVLDEGDPRRKGLDNILKDAAEAGVYGATIGLLFGGVVSGAQRSAYRQEIARTGEEIGSAEARVAALNPDDRYADIAERVNAGESVMGKPSELPPVTADIVRLAAELDGGTPTGEVQAAWERLNEARARLATVQGSGDKFFAPQDLEAVAEAQSEQLAALRDLEIAQGAHASAIGSVDMPVPAGLTNALTVAREVQRFADEPAMDASGKVTNVSQREIAQTVARVAFGGVPAASDLNLKGADGKPIFKSVDGRVQMVNPVTRAALEAEAPALARAWSAYEANPVETPASTTGESGPRFRLSLRGGDGSVVREVEFPAASETEARQMAADGTIPGLNLQPGEKFDAQTDLAQVAAGIPASESVRKTGSISNEGDERFAPKDSRKEGDTKPIPASEVSTTTPNPHEALEEEIAVGVSATPEERPAIARVAAVIGDSLAKWRGLFQGVSFEFNPVAWRPTAGFLYDPSTGHLVVNLADVLREESNRNPKALDRRILEEFIHHAAVSANVDAANLYLQLPAALKADIEAAYPGAANDFARGHEFLRMVVQNRVMISDDGKLTWRDEGGEETTEQLTPRLAQAIRDAVARLVKHFRDLARTLRAQGASEDVVNAVNEAIAMIRHNMAPALTKNFEKPVETKAATADEAPSSKASTQLNLSAEAAKPFLDFGRSIPESELYTAEEDYGRDTEPHVTIVYGPEATPEQLESVLKGIGPITLKFGEVSVFSNDDSPYDVVKVNVESSALRELHRRIKGKFGTASSFPDYTPHLTIAYVKKGEGAKYVGDKRFEGTEVTLPEFMFSDRFRNKTPISLGATSAGPLPATPVPPQPPLPTAETTGGLPSPGVGRGMIALKGVEVPTAGGWSAKNPRGAQVVTGTVALVPLRLLTLNTNLSDAQDRLNRDQTGAAQRAEIVRNMTGENVGLAWDAGNSLVEGSPIIDPSGSVLVGNNRAMALRDIYGDPNQVNRAAVYQQWSRRRARELGLDPMAFSGEPVALVRVVDDLGGQSIADFVRAANKAGTQQKTMAENALSEAGFAGAESTGEFYRRANQPEDMRDSAGRPDESKIRARQQNAKLAALLRPAPEGAQTATQVIDQQNEAWARGPLVGSLNALAEASLDLRAKDESGMADALGRFGQKLVQNQIAEGNFEKALRRTAEQSEANIDQGSDTATVQRLADAFREETAMVTTKGGKTKFDADLTLEGIEALMGSVRKAVDAFSAEPDMFGGTETAGEKIRAAIDRHRQLKDSMLMSQAGEAADVHLANVALSGSGESNPRFDAATASETGRENLTREYRRLFDRQRAGETLTPGQRAAFEGMERALGQRLLFNVEQSAPVRQMPLLSQAADDRPRKKAFLLGDPVAETTGDAVPKFEKFSQLIGWAARDWHDRFGGEVENPEIGKVLLDKRAAKESVSHGMSRDKAQSLAIVPEIIRKGIVLDSRGDLLGRPLDWFTLAAPVRVGGKDFYGVAVVKRSENRQGLYLHEVVLKEKAHRTFKTGAPEEQRGTATDGLVLTLLRDVLNVNEGPLASQPAAPIDFEDPSTLERLDALQKIAMGETYGNRTVGDPAKAFAADNELWMGMDELRKERFQAQRESDWEKTARQMLAANYQAVRAGIIDSGFSGIALDPIRTKAAQIIISEETRRPMTPEQRLEIQKLIYAYRETGTASARAMTARKDPHRTKAERYREFFARRLYSVPPSVQRLIEGAPSARTMRGRITDLERRLALAKGQNNANEVRLAEKELELARKVETKESLLEADADGRVQKVLGKLEKMGVSLDDILGEQVELRLMGAKIIKDVAGTFAERERKALRLLQQARGALNPAQLAAKTGLSADEVLAVNTKFLKQMEDELAARFARGINPDELELAGTQGALFSQTDRQPRTDEEARQMAKQALRMMGFFQNAELGKIKTRRARVKVEPRVGTGNPNMFGPNPDFVPPRTGALPLEDGGPLAPNSDFAPGDGRLFPLTPGTPLDVNPEFAPPRTGVLPLENPTSLEPNPEFAPGAPGRLFPSPEPGPLPENADFQFGTNGRLLPEPEISYRDALVAMKLDPDNDVDMLHLNRAMSIAEGGRWTDYANEIIFNNLLSAPLTGITNLTGYAYAAYEMGIRRGIEAAINRAFKNHPDAAQFGEIKPMLQALGRGWSRALANGVNAFSTESPVFEQDVLGGQLEFDSNILERVHGPRIPGKLGRVVRIPTRLLMGVDEGMKTMIGQAQAAAIAYRMGKARGLTKEAMEAFIGAQLAGQGSPAWQIAYEDAKRLSFQTPLRTFATMRDEGEKNPLVLATEGILKNLQDFKNLDARGQVAVEIAQMFTNLVFPFIRTPYRLLQLGLENTLGGAAMKMLNAKDVTTKVGDKKVRTVTPLNGESAKLAAQATLLTSALATLLLAGAGEGDSDDDDKWLMITGSRPRGSDEDKKGLRELGQRTVPQYTIRIGGKNGLLISYERIDPFATAIATTVDALKNVKQLRQGRPKSEAASNVLASVYNQLLEKANLRGLSELNDLATGRQSTTDYALDTISSALVPNLIKNPLRNADPMVREQSQLMTPSLALYKMLPAEVFAPPVKVDVYGRPIEKRGNVLTRSLVPGQPGTQTAEPEPLDAFLARYNFLHPSNPWAPTVPPNRTETATGEREMSPEEYNKFLRVRGGLFRRYTQESGVVSRRAPTTADLDEIKKAASKATRDAKKLVFGATARSGD